MIKAFAYVVQGENTLTKLANALHKSIYWTDIVLNSLEKEGFIYFRTSLMPGLESKANISYSEYNTVARIQVTPFIKSSKVGERVERIVLCNNRKVSQDITCS